MSVHLHSAVYVVADPKGSVSAERMERLLEKYPETAYTLIFYTDKDINRLQSAGNIDWLPVAVPLIDMDTFNGILEGKGEKTGYWLYMTGISR